MKLKSYLWHRFLYRFLRYMVGPFVKLYMGYRCAKQKGPSTPSLIVSNHNTDLDPALVGLSFTRHIYFLASEHALRAGLPSKILKFGFSPIPINKALPDLIAIKEMIRRLKAGANVCLFAEGDRSFNGVTSPIALSTAKLAKRSGADLITFHIEGAYFVSPRWSKIKRKGRIRGTVANTYSAEFLKTKTAEEVLELIERDLYEDAYQRQKENPRRYTGNNQAKGIETVLYLCPGCEAFGLIESESNNFSCDCGLGGIYTETGFLDGDSLPFKTITEWDRWQTEQLVRIVRSAGYEPICTDKNQKLFEVRPAIDKALVGEGIMYIDRSMFHCAGKHFPLDSIARFAVVGQMVLLFALKDGTSYEVRSAHPRSALKYREIFKVLTGE